MDLQSVFGTTGAVTWGQEVARGLLIFFYGLALVRLAGRRVFGKWAALDIVISVIIGSSLSRALTGNAPLWGTMAASAVLMGVHWLLAQAASRSSLLSHILEGRAVCFGSGGTLDERRRKRLSVSEADLGEALRRAGAESLSDLREIVVEPSGRLIAIRR